MKNFIGDNCFVIAEMGASHHQDFLTACDIVDAAVFAGADAVKVQMFKPDSLTAQSNEDMFVLQDGPWAGQTLWELYEKAYMPYEWVPALKERAEKAGLKFIASIYDVKTVAVAETMAVKAYKVSSYEAAEEDLLKRLGETQKPVFVSTGNLDWKQIRAVTQHIQKLALLKCTSRYPAPLDQMNLRTLLDMKRTFTPYVGLSDHTTGTVAAVMAVGMGARIIEKHIKIDNEGLDSSFAIMPEQFGAMVKIVRAAENSIGKVFYGGKSQIKRAVINGKSVRIVEKDHETADNKL